jgi:hypothetical protein
MIRLILLCFIIFIFHSCRSNFNEEYNCGTYYYDKSIDKKIYLLVPEMPEFKGGDNFFLLFFINNYSPPPNEFQYSFYFEIVIGEEGEVLSVKIPNKNTISHSEKLAIETIKKMPRWKPGKCNNKTVSVKIYKNVKLSL